MSAPDFMINRNNGKSYYALAQNVERDVIVLAIYDKEDPKNPDAIHFISDKTFIDSLSQTLDHRFIGVVLHLFEYNPPNYKSNYEFCCDIRRRLTALKIPYFFAARSEKCNSTALIGPNITSKIGDIVLLILNGMSNFIIFEYKFTENGYFIIEIRLAPYIPEPEAVTKSKIMGKCNPTVILGYTPFNGNPTARLSSIMKSEKNFSIVNFELHGYKYAGEMVKWLNNKSYVKYFIQPVAWKNTGIVGVMGKDARDLFGIKCDTQLPAEKSFIVSKNFSHYIVLSINESNRSQQDVITRKEISRNCHKNEVTISMDINQFLTIDSKAIIIPEIEALPKKLDKTLESKIPVIGFYEYSSVICVSKGGEGYKFLDEWGGLYGNELFINFEKEPTKFGSEAITPFDTSMTSVVFDLINIMSMKVTDIVKDPKWKFKVVKDSEKPLENPVLLEFIKHDGKPGAQTPAFFMAMLLKEQIRKIKKKLGEKPREIGFCFFDEILPIAKKRLEKKLQESCELLKIKCSFV